jgi:hypothetical protein
LLSHRAERAAIDVRLPSLAPFSSRTDPHSIRSSDRDFVRFVSRRACELPSVEKMHLALRDDPARLLKYGVRALSAFLVVGRRLAAYLHRLQHQIPTAVDAEELMQMWARLESHCQWGREVLGPVMGRDDLDKFSVVVLEVCPAFLLLSVERN